MTKDEARRIAANVAKLAIVSEKMDADRETAYLRAKTSSIFAMRSSDCEIVSRLSKAVSCRSHCSCHKCRRLFRIEATLVSRSLGKCNGWSGIAVHSL